MTRRIPRTPGPAVTRAAVRLHTSAATGGACAHATACLAKLPKKYRPLVWLALGSPERQEHRAAMELLGRHAAADRVMSLGRTVGGLPCNPLGWQGQPPTPRRGVPPVATKSCYKDIRQVMAAQSDLLEVLAECQPCFLKMVPSGERPED